MLTDTGINTQGARGIAADTPAPACTKHLYRAVQERAMQKKSPTGHPSGSWGIWQQRRCVYCQCTASRWKPGINESSVHRANQENRSTSAQLARALKLERIEREHAAASGPGREVSSPSSLYVSSRPAADSQPSNSMLTKVSNA